MGEPRLMTKEQYFDSWEKHNDASQPYNTIQKKLMAFILAFGFNGVVAAEIYGYGHSKSGPWVMILFMAIFAICLLISVCIQKCKRRRYELWEKYFPYDPEREFPVEHFRKNIHRIVGCRPRRVGKR